MLSKLEEEKGYGSVSIDRSKRSSLKDRFKMLRMRGEAGLATALDENDTPETAAEALAKSGAASLAPASAAEDAGDEPPPSPIPSPIAELAPGTVSGVNAGPSAMPDTQVDWDLWQSVVYEGPAAVARTSPEELNRAIATGIPNAIRGVIWQVLAQSKNDELETVYKDLVAQGTDKAKSLGQHSPTASASSNGNPGAQNGEQVASSAASVQSDQSGGQSGAAAEKVPDAVSKAQTTAAAAERKKKEKEEVAKIQKLEKVIRRDLGTRTSFSKYAAAAGLQEGLFGVCKAYALYDEDVGYAQGMNFLTMPLLFNVSSFCPGLLCRY